jgi:hypothetical protein
MKALITFLLVLSSVCATSQTALTNAALTTRINAADTQIARANRNITTLFTQNDSYKKQLTEAQSTIAKLVADTILKSKKIALLDSAVSELNKVSKIVYAGPGIVFAKDSIAVSPIILSDQQSILLAMKVQQNKIDALLNIIKLFAENINSLK